MTTAKRITERVIAPFRGARVNRAAGTIDGVLICGTVSANGRDYPAAVFQRDYAKYEGRPVNCDHGRQATVDRRFGWFTNVRPGPDGRPRGTLNCLKTHPMYARVMEAAERNPALFGFSHVAVCRTRPGTGGREVVEAIDHVESIDLVAEPATTRSLFEGHNVPMTTLRAVIETLRPRLTGRRARAARQLLLEDDATATDPGTGSDTGMMDAPVAEPDPGADAGPALDQAFIDAAVAEMRDCMAARGDPVKLKKCLGKLKKMLQAHAEITADPDAPDDSDTGADIDADADTDEADGSMPEGRVARAGAVLEALAVCDRVGLRATRADLELIAAAPAGRRVALAERLKRAEPERPTSTGRGRLTPGADRPTGRPPADPKTFAEWLQ